MKENNKNIKYEFTGVLDVEDTVRKIRDNKIKNGKYNGHSRYLWRALELRNMGLDNYEIAETLEKETSDKLTKSYIQNLFDSYKIESNPVKSGKKRTDASSIILDEETYRKIDIESLKTGCTPVIIMEELFDSTVNGIRYTDRRSLRKIWEASYAKYNA